MTIPVFLQKEILPANLQPDLNVRHKSMIQYRMSAIHYLHSESLLLFVARGFGYRHSASQEIGEYLSKAPWQ